MNPTKQNISLLDKWLRVVSLHSLHEIGHSAARGRILATACMTPNKPLKGWVLEVWKTMDPVSSCLHTKASLFGLLAS